MDNELEFQDKLEFHYVVSFMNGRWGVTPELDEAAFPNGNIYDWENAKWKQGFGDGNDEEIILDTLDTSHYHMLVSALRLMNGDK